MRLTSEEWFPPSYQEAEPVPLQLPPYSEAFPGQCPQKKQFRDRQVSFRSGQESFPAVPYL